MRLCIFSVHDQAAGVFMQPFHAVASGIAVRGFADAINDPQHDFSKHPGDYTLFELGTFDQETGQYTIHEAAKNLGNGLTFLATPQ